MRRWKLGLVSYSLSWHVTVAVLSIISSKQRLKTRQRFQGTIEGEVGKTEPVLGQSVQHPSHWWHSASPIFFSKSGISKQ